jgi:hypothetical protein
MARTTGLSRYRYGLAAHRAVQRRNCCPEASVRNPKTSQTRGNGQQRTPSAAVLCRRSRRWADHSRRIGTRSRAGTCKACLRPSCGTSNLLFEPGHAGPSCRCRHDMSRGLWDARCRTQHSAEQQCSAAAGSTDSRWRERKQARKSAIAWGYSSIRVILARSPAWRNPPHPDVLWLSAQCV